MTDMISEFVRLDRAWNSAVSRKLAAEEHCDEEAYRAQEAREEGIYEELMAITDRINSKPLNGLADLYALAVIAKAHNKDLQSSSANLDEASVARLIDAVIKLGRRC